MPINRMPTSSQVSQASVINRIIWIFWFQGWDDAPWLVRKCLASWQVHNPDWDIRILDSVTVQQYIELPDLDGKEITHASMSDIIRSLLLHEYGGVWVDATLLCNAPLDSWLPAAAVDGFFAFDRPGPDRLLSSWFIAACEGHPLIAYWHAAVLKYWAARDKADAYFWFHYLFGELYTLVPEFCDLWNKVKKISADGPHKVQRIGFFDENEEIVAQAKATLSPVTKLTYRFNEARLTPTCLLSQLVTDLPEPVLPKTPHYTEGHKTLASLKVGTKNLGDHIQVLASLGLIDRVAHPPAHYIDRDDEIGSCPSLAHQTNGYPIVLNGWFKTNGAEWPPSEQLDPLFIGFHIRLFQCPELLSPRALDYYRAHGPIGCRDQYTLDLLKAHDVETYLSHCLTLTFPRRPYLPDEQTEVFVVSRDERILAHLPDDFKAATFISHYVKGRDFEENMQAAKALLETYRSRARLIVTTLLHCALPAMAMGIPVVMLYPENTEAGHASDQERFSSLKTLITVHELDQLANVDWQPKPISLSAVKLGIVDHFYPKFTDWALPAQDHFPSIAPSSALQP
jgi:hypothetical protein